MNKYKSLIDKYLAGECSEEELSKLILWYNSFEEDKNSLMLPEKKRELLGDKIFSRIRLKNSELAEMMFERIQMENKFRKSRGLLYSGVAVIVGLIIWIGFFFWGIRDQTNEILTSKIENNQAGQYENELMGLSNMTNQIQLITLDDSSKVWLHPGARLEYPSKFDSQVRKIRLSGEAFFEVYRIEDKPFIVDSKNFITTVLGTSFLIRNSDSGQKTVSVVTGKVEVQNKNDKAEKIFLNAKESVSVKNNLKLLKENEIEKGIVNKWNRISLSFDNEPLSEVINALYENFGVQISCKDDVISDYKLNADFNNQNLADILNMMGTSLNIKYRMVNDSTIYFYKNN